MGRYKEPYTIFKRGKYWYYRTYTPDGVRTVAKTTGKKTKQEARQFCESLYLCGKLYTSDVTFGEYSRGFYADNSLYFRDRAEPLAKNTIENYQRCYNLYIMPYFQNYKISDINYSALKQFRAFLIENGYKSNTIQNTMSVLKHVINAAYKDNIISENPFFKLETLTIRQGERDAFTLEEIKILYKKIPEEFKSLILLMALSGMRISEAVGVTAQDIKQCDGFNYIDLKRQLNKKEYKELKGKEARPVPVITEIINCIGFEPSRVSAFYREFEPIKKTFSDYEKRLLCPHSIRHFFITNSKSYGVIESKVEFIAGHKLKKMAGVYTNYKPEDLKEILKWQKETLIKIKS